MGVRGPPPAGQGTISAKGLAGMLCAVAPGAPSASTNPAAALLRSRFIEPSSKSSIDLIIAFP